MPFRSLHRLLVVVEPDGGSDGGVAPLVIATQVAGTDGPGRRFGFQAAVLAGRELPVVISETDVAGPARGWELRTSGLWADHVCETVDRHWSYGLEAFGLAIDDPEELLGRAMGDRVPLGWELEFEASAPPRASGPDCQIQAGVVHGLLLGPDGARPIEGRGLRGQGRITAPPANGSSDVGSWLGDRIPLVGGPDPASVSAPGAALEVFSDDVVVEVALPTAAGVWWVARTASGVRTRGW